MQTLFVKNNSGLKTFNNPTLVLETRAAATGKHTVVCRFVLYEELSWDGFTEVEADSLVQHILIMLGRIR